MCAWWRLLVWQQLCVCVCSRCGCKVQHVWLVCSLVVLPPVQEQHTRWPLMHWLVVVCVCASYLSSCACRSLHHVVRMCVCVLSSPGLVCLQMRVSVCVCTARVPAALPPVASTSCQAGPLRSQGLSCVTCGVQGVCVCDCEGMRWIEELPVHGVSLEACGCDVLHGCVCGCWCGLQPCAGSCVFPGPLPGGDVTFLLTECVDPRTPATISSAQVVCGSHPTQCAGGSSGCCLLLSLSLRLCWLCSHDASCSGFVHMPAYLCA